MTLTGALLTAINEAAMKQTGKPLPGFAVKQKEGERPKIINIDKAPKHAKIAKRNKTSRQVKAWAKAGRKTT